MRAYLQRCEVRLSTIHRIALAFIGGAGLLLLIPVFFKDVIDNIILILLQQSVNQFPEYGLTGIVLSMVLFLALGYPLMLSLVIPMYAVYLLLKDIIHFYFTIYMPGFSGGLLNPTFALSGLLFWSDEGESIKHETMRYQYQRSHMNFMIPFSEGKREHYFDTIIKETNGAIVPCTRQLDNLKAAGVISPDVQDKDVLRFNTALGLARSLDRTLVEDVAQTEMSMVRHIIYLRRLVMRYVKTLMMFIWTNLVSFLMLPFLHDPNFPPLLVLALGYLVWSLAVLPIMQMPLNWIYRHRRNDPHIRHVDPQLVVLEVRVEKFCYLAIAAALAGLVLSAIAYL